MTTDAKRRHLDENWHTVHGILEGRTSAISAKEIVEHWPDDAEKPSRATLYAWLALAFEGKRIRRQGQGTKNDPWIYRLPNEDDKYRDRGELPPLKELDW